MRIYYQNNKDKFVRTEEQNNLRNEYRRKRYAESSELREKAREQANGWRKRNPEKRLANVLKTFGITVEQYYAMHESQNGVCAICGGNSSSGRLRVDHCHSTGKVRGLLCDSCNLGLGKLGDTAKSLEKALLYLRAAEEQVENTDN
ncbi:MAG: endonuclease VII domain-containing protein [bacterium]|nr:endonuclease VII domain-containing protein [bacterium]